MSKDEMTTMDGKPLAQAIKEANELLKKNIELSEQEVKEDDAEGGYFEED